MRLIRPALPEDLPRALDEAAAVGMPLDILPSALFVAEVDGAPVGLVGIDWSTPHVQVGPLLTYRGHPAKPWVVLRLIEFAEDFLHRAGVRSYIFRVHRDNTTWQRVIARAGVTPYAEQDGWTWYVREVNTYGPRTQDRLPQPVRDGTATAVRADLCPATAD